VSVYLNLCPAVKMKKSALFFEKPGWQGRLDFHCPTHDR
jgi:hypothetical protein